MIVIIYKKKLHKIQRLFLILCTIGFPTCLSSQNKLTDSTVLLKEVSIVTIYPSKISSFRSPVSISILKHAQLKEQSDYSLVPALNSIPGIRMEERSPGSYRLSIRGSLIRSPFGIRNIKIYMDEFPLTDAGGNSYLNLLDPVIIKNIEIIKGPEGSLFGANTGGVLLLNLLNKKTDSSTISGTVSTGSFNLLNEHLTIDKQWKKYRLTITESFHKNDGYRENSRFQRSYFQILQQWNYKNENVLKLFSFYSNLQYQTPGSLTLEQFQENPTLARPATKTLPGAIEQKAGIYNQTIYGGISHETFLLPRLKQVITLFAAHTDFKNPFITNYETRKENTFGTRTYFELNGGINDFLKWKWNIGFEGSQTQSDISNYENIKGNKDMLQTADNIDVQQQFLFSQFSIDIKEKWLGEAAISINDYQYHYKNLFPTAEMQFRTKQLHLQLLPRVGISYKILHNLIWRFSTSKGYSPPTIAEIRPSDNSIYTNLQAESGWNYETGMRLKNTSRFEIDLTLFNFQLQNTIVRRVNLNNEEYFVNAGKTKQQGIEIQLIGQLIKPNQHYFIRGLDLRNSFSYYNFLFTSYQINSENYTGNRITGIPQYTMVTNMLLQFPQKIYLFTQYNYTDKLPLNDANTVYASSYNLLQIKGGWTYTNKKWNVELFLGVDNVLNSLYSLGNDINAVGDRYYNAAPSRNYFIGIKTFL